MGAQASAPSAEPGPPGGVVSVDHRSDDEDDDAPVGNDKELYVPADADRYEFSALGKYVRLENLARASDVLDAGTLNGNDLGGEGVVRIGWKWPNGESTQDLRVSGVTFIYDSRVGRPSASKSPLGRIARYGTDFVSVWLPKALVTHIQSSIIAKGIDIVPIIHHDEHGSRMQVTLSVVQTCVVRLIPSEAGVMPTYTTIEKLLILKGNNVNATVTFNLTVKRRSDENRSRLSLVVRQVDYYEVPASEPGEGEAVSCSASAAGGV
jgi:hypothetical protein